MTTPRSYCWIAGYTKRVETGAASDPEEDCAALEPGEWEAGQRAAGANLEAFERWFQGQLAGSSQIKNPRGLLADMPRCTEDLKPGEGCNCGIEPPNAARRQVNRPTPPVPVGPRTS